MSVYNQLGIELNRPDEKTTGGPDPYKETLPPDFNETLGAKKVSAATTKVFIMTHTNSFFLNIKTRGGALLRATWPPNIIKVNVNINHDAYCGDAILKILYIIMNNEFWSFNKSSSS
jgi:hypothetical protein